MMKTLVAKPQDIKRNWVLVDATQQTLGRLAVDIALRLRGKHNPCYTPHIDTGDYVVVVHASKLYVSGNKRSEKVYRHHTGYPGGLKETHFDKLQQRHPGRVLEIAVRGMLPKGPLGRAMFKKLKVYPAAEHEHQAQNPTPAQTLFFRTPSQTKGKAS